MNSCLRGREMLLDLQRSDFLPPWDEEGMRTVINEMVDAHARMKHHTEGCDVEAIRSKPEAVRASISYNLNSIHRNRRYVNRYFFCFVSFSSFICIHSIAHNINIQLHYAPASKASKFAMGSWNRAP